MGRRRLDAVELRQKRRQHLLYQRHRLDGLDVLLRERAGGGLDAVELRQGQRGPSVVLLRPPGGYAFFVRDRGARL